VRDLQALLEEAAAAHGHLCPGQVLGVRMALAGCHALGIEEPNGSKRLLVYLEIDRCAADAISTVTGCRLGKRTLKHVDYGKMAATFVDTVTGRAVRVVAREEAREQAAVYAPDVHGDQHRAQEIAYAAMPDEELFMLQEVRLAVREEDRPGPPVSRVRCSRCGEGINDRREVHIDGHVLCRACAGPAYYEVVDL
jgi:formylmethanofuran dehydrogenase subunit E